MKTLLTIITIVKDDLNGFKRTFDSIGSELSPQIEFLIVDSSRDKQIQDFLRSHQIIDFKYFFQEPQGIYPAMNFGIDLSAGKWIWFLNAGDTKHTACLLSEILKIIEISAEMHAIAFSVNHVIAENLVWSSTKPTINLVSGSQVIDCNHQGFIAQKSAVLGCGGFDTNYRYAADSKLMDTITRGGKFLIYDLVIANFQIGGTSSTNFRSVVDEIARHRNQADNSNYTLSLRIAVIKNYLRLKLLYIIAFLPIELRKAIVSIRNSFRSL